MVAAVESNERFEKANSEIKRKARELGLYKADYLYYLLYFTALIAAVAYSVYVIGTTESRVVWIAFAPIMAFLHTHLSYIAHDAGHDQVFPTRKKRNQYALLVLCLLVGIGPSWWVYTHDAHHRDPNDTEKDPNVKVEPFLAFSPEQLAKKSAFWRWAIRYQDKYYYVLVALETINMTWNSFEFLLSNKKKERRRYRPHRWLELMLLTAHFVIYFSFLWLVMGYWMFAFVVVHKILQGLYLGAVFAPNHKGMDVVDDEAKRELSWLERQVITTRNVFRGWFGIITFLTGGLNYQVEHHLLWNVPRRRLGKARAFIKPMIEELGLPYYEMSFRASFMEVVRYFRRIGLGLIHTPRVARKAAR